jgi:tetratricopeptide (TPR) repeat protein
LLGHVYLFAGNVDAAVDAFLRASILDPADAQLYVLLGRIEGGRGNQAEAAQYLQTAAQLIGSDAPTIVLVAHGYALAGLQEQAVEFVTRFRALTANSAFLPVLLHALASLALGESDEALKFLTSAAEGEASSYGVVPMQVKFNVFSDPTLDEPEFVKVRSRLGFRE